MTHPLFLCFSGTSYLPIAPHISPFVHKIWLFVVNARYAHTRSTIFYVSLRDFVYPSFKEVVAGQLVQTININIKHNEKN